MLEHLKVSAATPTPSRTTATTTSATSLAAPGTGCATGGALAASCTVRGRGNALAASCSVSGGGSALAASALRFLGEQRKAHQHDQTGNKQNLELFHDAPFSLADIWGSIVLMPAAKSKYETRGQGVSGAVSTCR